MKPSIRALDLRHKFTYVPIPTSPSEQFCGLFRVITVMCREFTLSVKLAIFHAIITVHLCCSKSVLPVIQWFALVVTITFTVHLLADVFPSLLDNVPVAMLFILPIVQVWSLPNQLDETFSVEARHVSLATALADWQRMAHDASCYRQSKTILVVSGHDLTQLDRLRWNLLPLFNQTGFVWSGLDWSCLVCCGMYAPSSYIKIHAVRIAVLLYLSWPILMYFLNL